MSGSLIHMGRFIGRSAVRNSTIMLVEELHRVKTERIEIEKHRQNVEKEIEEQRMAFGM
jgi:hypothetical protein